MYSVIIPAYNCAETITESIKSVYNQTAFNLIEEVIVVDDGSNDETADKISEFIERYDENHILQYIYEENKGPSAARNTGIQKSKGEWIALLDGDDIWLENKLERQTQIIRENPEISFIGSEYPLRIFFRKRKGLIRLTPEELCIRNMPVTPSVVYKKEKAIKLGLYNEELRYCEDLNFHQKFFRYNSYYVLAENLVRIGIQKKYLNEQGKSANLYEMYQGRNRNIRELYQMGHISRPFLVFALVFSYMKHVRRIIMCCIQRIKYKE